MEIWQVNNNKNEGKTYLNKIVHVYDWVGREQAKEILISKVSYF